MKSLVFFFCFCISLQSTAQIRDVPYNFDRDKIASTRSPLEFFRTFVDYFYLLEKKNLSQQHFVSAHAAASGWCFGDAHLENFGTVLLASGDSIFTINDWDDAGPCPVILDFFRLSVSAALYNPTFTFDEVLAAYQRGLRQQKDSIPNSVRLLLIKSLKKGTQPQSGVVKNGKFIRTSTSFELGALEKLEIAKILDQMGSSRLGRYTWIDSLRTTKKDGGSFGLIRYQILFQDRQNKSQFLHLELKEQVSPSIYPVLRASQLPTVAEKIVTSLRLSQGDHFSQFYGVFSVLGKPMLLRPRFAGNDSLKMSDLTPAEAEALVAYEANFLGLIQGRNTKIGKSFTILNEPLELQNLILDVHEMSAFIRKRYLELSKIR